MIRNKYQRKYYDEIKKNSSFIEKRKNNNKIYYEKNREKIINRQKKNIKKNNYKYEKTPEQRTIRTIKRKTRMYFPLEGHNCEFCGIKAIEHHHNTNPIEFDRFNYSCHSCHLKQHKELKKEVKNTNGRRYIF